jgi:YVTN family beta-propeller protein
MKWRMLIRTCSRLRHVWLLLGILLVTLPVAAGTVRVYVDYEGGNTIDVIDPVTQKIVQTIKGIEHTYGIMFSPDGRRVYVSSENENVLAVVDQKTGEIIKKVPLTGFPNNVVVTKDGRRVIVGIRQAPGALDIIDTTSLERVRTVPMKGGLHDMYLTPDGKFVVAGSTDRNTLTVVDIQTEQPEPLWQVKFDTSVLTLAVEANPDGSTRRVFVMRDLLRGFAVVDFAQRKVVAEIKLPETQASLKAESATKQDFSPCHGTGVAPDNKTFWINSHADSAVYAYSLPDLKLLGNVPIGLRPNWLAFSPDSKQVYDLNTEENTLSIIDVKAMKEMARIPVGHRPFKVNALELP